MQEGLGVLSSTTNPGLVALNSDPSTGRWRQKDQDLRAPFTTRIQSFPVGICIKKKEKTEGEKRKNKSRVYKKKFLPVSSRAQTFKPFLTNSIRTRSILAHARQKEQS